MSAVVPFPRERIVRLVPAIQRSPFVILAEPCEETDDALTAAKRTFIGRKVLNLRTGVVGHVTKVRRIGGELESAGGRDRTPRRPSDLSGFRWRRSRAGLGRTATAQPSTTMEDHPMPLDIRPASQAQDQADFPAVQFPVIHVEGASGFKFALKNNDDLARAKRAVEAARKLLADAGAENAVVFDPPAQS